MSKRLQINETLLKRLCLERHGSLGELAFQSELAKAQKALAEYEALSLEHTSLDAELAVMRSARPGLAELEQLRDLLNTEWLHACGAADQRRIECEGREAAVQTKIFEVVRRQRALIAFQPTGEWIPLSTTERAYHEARTPRESLAVSGEARLIALAGHSQ